MSTAAKPETTFPLGSYREAATHLRRPFTAQAVKFKVQATWPKDNPTTGLVVAYIDARLAVERLNLVVPHLWHDEYAQIDKGHMLCKLTVDGITRQDIGEGVDKGLFSDALKRAAVKFGIGVSLYAIPKMTISVSTGEAKPKRGPKGPTLEMTSAGEARCRAAYQKWLAEHGSKAFGSPLDHGDLDGAAGDADVESDVSESAVSEAAPYGMSYDKERGPEFAQACTRLTGSAEAGKQLWVRVAETFGGYMPQAAAVALLEADRAALTIPEVEAPEVR